MDWLKDLTQKTAVIVPTRSLANSLQEQVAAAHLAKQQAVWEAPTIIVWPDYLQQLWLANKAQMTEASQVISNQQSLLLWHKVVDASRREESQFTLLDVQQTSKAMQSSWRLMHDWMLDIDAVKDDHAADTQQFIEWFEAYQSLMRERAYLDSSLLAHRLMALELHIPFKEVIWYAYDLKTKQQQEFDLKAEQNDVVVRNISTSAANNQASHKFISYESSQQELSYILGKIRDIIESDPSAKINLVVPNLQMNQTQVRQLAKDVFYPSLPPLAVQANHKAFRFSLGEALPKWPAIDNALRVLKLLKNHIAFNDISLLLRSEYMSIYQQQPLLCMDFIRWMQKQRLTHLSIEKLLQQVQAYQAYYADIDASALLEFFSKVAEHRAQLQQRLSNVQYNALSFVEWADVYIAWLELWGWRPAADQEEFGSDQYQLFERWGKLLEEYRTLGLVQQKVSLGRALDILMQLARDAVFLPKAPASPLLISGVYEAIGQKADYCFVVGMDDRYPSAVKPDAFIPNRLLLAQGYPEASNLSSFEQAERVIKSLLSGAHESTISFAKSVDEDDQASHTMSALFRNDAFKHKEENTYINQTKNVELETYQDTQGKPWPAGAKARGGANLFENQSNCAFKAFVTHQLTFARQDEAEFGLDALDRGNIVHLILQAAWEKLQLQSELLKLDKESLTQFCEQTVAQVIASFSQENLSDDKRRLLTYENKRLSLLLAEWLDVDAKRPTPFSVIETEERRNGEYGGIEFQYVIDRLDMLEDGRTVVVDYKTGVSQRNDWIGERIKKPQLPLYSLALERVKQNGVSGIAYGQAKRHNSKYSALSEASIFKNSASADEKYEQQWLENRQQWPAIFTQLASDFLAGKAAVNPIEKTTCEYCELQSVCRVSQLRRSEHHLADGGKA